MIPAPLATHVIALLLGINLAALGCIGLALALIRKRVDDLTAMHHDLIAKLLIVRGAKPAGTEWWQLEDVA